MHLRIGLGYDVHRLARGRDFYLGGIKINHTQGAVGHSDADVLIHAICDALLGAANLRDIGFHFPDTEKQYKNIDSKKLLEKVSDMVKEKGYCIVNIDSTVCLQVPKIQKYIPDMQKTLAQVLAIDEQAISIKATTGEGLGFVGREEGVVAYAIVLLQMKKEI